MKAATITEIKKELQQLEREEIINLCLRLARYKKDNKELLTYIIFESDDEENYVESLKAELDDQFEQINYSNVYYTKKGLRKVLRFLDKFIRYSGNKETEVNCRLYFCELINENRIPIERSKVLTNLYNRQIDKIKKAISVLHEDLQYDYERMLEDLHS